VTKAEREEFAKKLYEEYNDTTDGQISYESLGHMYGKATSTVHRLINQHKAKVEG
jgi:hypothetical protein